MILKFNQNVFIQNFQSNYNVIVVEFYAIESVVFPMIRKSLMFYISFEPETKDNLLNMQYV